MFKFKKIIRTSSGSSFVNVGGSCLCPRCCGIIPLVTHVSLPAVVHPIECSRRLGPSPLPWLPTKSPSHGPHFSRPPGSLFPRVGGMSGVIWRRQGFSRSPCSPFHSSPMSLKSRSEGGGLVWRCSPIPTMCLEPRGVILESLPCEGFKDPSGRVGGETRGSTVERGSAAAKHCP